MQLCLYLQLPEYSCSDTCRHIHSLQLVEIQVNELELESKLISTLPLL